MQALRAGVLRAINRRRGKKTTAAYRNKTTSGFFCLRGSATKHNKKHTIMLCSVGGRFVNHTLQ